MSFFEVETEKCSKIADYPNICNQRWSQAGNAAYEHVGGFEGFSEGTLVLNPIHKGDANTQGHIKRVGSYM